MKLVTLVFDRDHTHAGQPIAAGETREIPNYTADWLIAHGIARIAPAPKPAATTKPRRGDTTEENDHVD